MPVDWQEGSEHHCVGAAPALLISRHCVTVLGRKQLTVKKIVQRKRNFQPMPRVFLYRAGNTILAGELSSHQQGLTSNYRRRTEHS